MNKSISHFLKLLFIVCILFTIFGLINYNMFNIKDILEQSTIYNRFESSGLKSSRFDAWKAALSGIKHYPYGGLKTNISINYVHNLWLDVVHETGIIPFFLLLMITMASVMSFIKVLRKNFSVLTKSFILTFLVSFFIIFMTEPILSTQERVYFSIFCLFLGVVQSANIDEPDSTF